MRSPTLWETRTLEGSLTKRFMLSIVGAGIGALAGLWMDSMGGGIAALWVCAAIGAIVPQFVLGPPGR